MARTNALHHRFVGPVDPEQRLRVGYHSLLGTSEFSQPGA
jgi:hypothetical protein